MDNTSFPAGIYFFKINNANTKTICEVGSKFQNVTRMTSLILLFKQLNAGWVKVKSTDTRTTSIDVVLLSMFLTLYKYVQCFCMF